MHKSILWQSNYTIRTKHCSRNIVYFTSCNPFPSTKYNLSRKTKTRQRNLLRFDVTKSFLCLFQQNYHFAGITKIFRPIIDHYQQDILIFIPCHYSTYARFFQDLLPSSTKIHNQFIIDANFSNYLHFSYKKATYFIHLQAISNNLHFHLIYFTPNISCSKKERTDSAHHKRNQFFFFIYYSSLQSMYFAWSSFARPMRFVLKWKNGLSGSWIISTGRSKSFRTLIALSAISSTV